MKVLQILLSQSEAGAETFFEKLAAAFAADPEIDQKLIIEALPDREERLRAVGCAFETLPMDWWGKRLRYNRRLRQTARVFAPEVTLTWLNRASRKVPAGTGVRVARIGGYYPMANFSRCHHIIAITGDLRRHALDGGWPPERVSVIPNFGDYPRAVWGGGDLPKIPDNRPVILALGRLHWKKGHDTLLRAVARLPGAHLLLAGDGELRDALGRLAGDLGIRDRVHFLGFRRDVADLFDRADLCVFPSRYEPNGTVVMEAWAHKTPLIAADSVGPKWWIEDGVDGLLFPVDDVDALVERARRVLREPHLAKALVAGGYAKYNRRLTQEVIVGKYKALFRRLIAGEA